MPTGTIRGAPALGGGGQQRARTPEREALCVVDPVVAQQGERLLVADALGDRPAAHSVRQVRQRLRQR